MSELGKWVKRALVAAVVAAAAPVSAAPFDRDFVFTQPDGTKITVHARGDEAFAFADFNGYSVLKIEKDGDSLWVYGRCSADRLHLEPTDARVGIDPIPEGVEIDEWAKLSEEGLAAVAATAQAKRELLTGNDDAWRKAKARRRAQRKNRHKNAFQSTLPIRGERIGLTVLVDFTDSPQNAKFTKREAEDFLNGESYTNFNNYCSVRSYYLDISNTNVDFRNVVVPYFTMPRTKAEYNALDQNTALYTFFGDLLEMIGEKMDADEDFHQYMTESYSQLTLGEEDFDGRRAVRSFNVLYAGEPDCGWAQGLWPCSGRIAAPDSGKVWHPDIPGAEGICLDRFLISDIGTSPDISTFCHESGHLVFDFPDIYDYTYKTTGGAGKFSLMSNNTAKNPQQVDAYLKYFTGWTTPVYLNKWEDWEGELKSFAEGAEAQNTILVFENPATMENPEEHGTATEYFLLENRQQEFHDALIPASGIAIWHVDELGDRDTPCTTAWNDKHKNYELTLMQADGQWHFQNGSNAGDSGDLYRSGYRTTFKTLTNPSSRWWDGSASDLSITNVGESASSMLVAHARKQFLFLTSQANEAMVGTPYVLSMNVLYVEEDTAWSIETDDAGEAFPAGLELDVESRQIRGVPTAPGSYSFRIRCTTPKGTFSEKSYTIVVHPPVGFPFEDDFSDGDLFNNGASGWYQEDGSDASSAYALTNGLDWTAGNGNADLSKAVFPALAHSDGFNARLRTESGAAFMGVRETTCESGPPLSPSTQAYSARRLLATPMIDCSSARTVVVSFYLCKTSFNVTHDSLRLLYRNALDEEWKPLQEFNASVGMWTPVAVTNRADIYSATTYFGLEGTFNGAYGVHIDDFRVFDYTTAPEFLLDTPSDLVIGEENEIHIELSGGIKPYVWDVRGDLPPGMHFADGVLSGTPTEFGTYNFTVVVVDDDGNGETISKTFTVEVDKPRNILWRENWETGNGDLPQSWSQEIVSVDSPTNVYWRATNGQIEDGVGGYPAAAKEGDYNANLFWRDDNHAERPDHITRLISPVIDLGQQTESLSLKFWLHLHAVKHVAIAPLVDQDELRVYIRPAGSDDWGEPLGVYTNSLDEWTLEKVSLPKMTGKIQICFEGNAKFGAGVFIDDVKIVDSTFSPAIRAAGEIPASDIGCPYEWPLSADGGTAPYHWSLLEGSELPAGMWLSEEGVFSGAPEHAGTYFFDVVCTGDDGASATATYSWKVRPAMKIDKFVGTFDTGMVWSAWTFVTNKPSSPGWIFINGGGADKNGLKDSPVPASAYAGDTNATLFTTSYSLIPRATMITPMLDFACVSNATVSFWLCKKSSQDQLRVYGLPSRNSAETNEIATITGAVNEWTQYTFQIENGTETYFLCFEGKTQGGRYGICVDEITLGGVYTNGELTIYEQWKEDHFAGTDGKAHDDDADDDGDGMNTYAEFFFGGDPHDSSDGGLSRLYPMLLSSDERILVYFQESTLARQYRQEQGGRTFKMLTCTDLTVQEWTEEGMIRPDDYPDEDNGAWWKLYFEYEDGTAGYPARFFKLLVE